MPPQKTTQKNKYPVDACKVYMRDLSNAGFGTIISNDDRRKSITFRKRPLQDMNEEQKENLKRINLDMSIYNDSFMEASDTSLESSSSPLQVDLDDSQS